MAKRALKKGKKRWGLEASALPQSRRALRGFHQAGRMPGLAIKQQRKRRWGGV